MVIMEVQDGRVAICPEGGSSFLARFRRDGLIGPSCCVIRVIFREMWPGLVEGTEILLSL